MVRKAFRNALLIQIVAAIVSVIGMVVDGAVTGSCLGTGAMAGYGFATPMATVFAACAGVCGLGSSILIGRLMGACKKEEASKALSACLLFALALSLVMIVSVFCFSHQIASFLGASGEIADMASDYLKGFAFCAPAMLLITVLMPVMQIDGKKNIVVLSVVVMTAVNVTGDLLVGLVFKGGLLGMSLATTVSYYAALALMLPYLFRKDNALRISFAHISFRYAGTMLSDGLPSALQQVCRSLLILVLNKELLRIADSNAVAAFTAIMSAANLCMVLGSGIGSSVSMLTGVFIGEKDDKAIRELMRLALRKAVLYDAVLFGILFLSARLIMPMFLADKSVAAMAVRGFRLYSLSMIGYSINVTLRLYYQSMHLSALSYVYVVGNSFLLTALGGLLLGELLGVSGVWLAFLFGETVTLILLTAYVLLRTKRGAGLSERFLFIPDSLTEDVLARYDSSAADAAEMARVSEAVHAFCLSNGATDRTAYVLSLAAEELGEYILAHNSGAKQETVEVRVLCKRESWTMRVRDNGSRFDPLTVLKEKNKDDFSYVGIRLIMDMLRNIEYLDTLNINNLNMEIEK